jgi:acyl-CoA thioesterase-1
MTVTTSQYLRFVHLEKLYGHLPGVPEHVPALFGLTGQEYDAARAGLDAQASEAADQLLARPGFRELVREAPFRPGDTVLAVGDSITDDLLSWAEILRHLVARVRPEDGITVTNAGLSAHTTAMVLRRWPAMLTAGRPDWVVCALGGNDVTRVGPGAVKPQVSLAESLANLRELRRVAGVLVDCRWVWMTPVPVHPERMAEFPGFRFGMSSWDNADIAELAEMMRSGLAEPVVDLVRTFGVPAAGDLQGDDGVHPSVLGQRAIVSALLEVMSDRGTGAV